MRIECPFCGERDLSEFSYLGDAHVARVRRELTGTLEAFVDAVYLRDNPRGVHRELWLHAFGCRRWLCVTRDTLTHEIHEITFAGVADEE
jgi:methylglutamate dehydrogenase subunit B